MLNLHYDPVARHGLVRLRQGKSVRTRRLSEQAIGEYDRTGRLLTIAISELDATAAEFLRTGDEETLLRVIERQAGTTKAGTRRRPGAPRDDQPERQPAAQPRAKAKAKPKPQAQAEAGSDAGGRDRGAARGAEEAAPAAPPPSVQRAPGGLDLGRRSLGAEPELRADRPQRVDHDLDVVVEVDAELRGALDHVVAVDAGREARCFSFLRTERGSSVERPSGRTSAAGVHEAGQLVAGEEDVLELALARRDVLQVVRVREHRPDEPLRVAGSRRNARAVLRMLVERRMPLVVEVVQQRDAAPGVLVGAARPGVGAHRGLDRVGVPAERLGVGPLVQQRERGGAIAGEGLGIPCMCFHAVGR